MNIDELKFPYTIAPVRLSLLAKKLNVGIVTIVEKLASVGIKIENNPNAKVHPEGLIILTKKYNNYKILGVDNYLYYCQITNLKKIDLSNFYISEIPKKLYELDDLFSLDLSNNQINDISSLEKFTELKFLSLSNNNITNYGCLEKLIQLQSLDLSSNRQSNIDCLVKLTGLRILSATDNYITDISCLKQLTDLQFLNLENNKITDISCLEKLVKLEFLSLSINQITEISPQLFKKLLRLNHLELYINPIKNIPEEIFNIRYENVFQEVKDYFNSLEKQENIFPLYEA